MSEGAAGEFVLDAALDLIPSDHGGRLRGLADGYRAALWFGETAPNGAPALYTAVVSGLPDSGLAPGRSSKVRLKPLAFEAWPPIDKGTNFVLFEGSRRIGTGRVLSSQSEGGWESDLAVMLHRAFEGWIAERFATPVRYAPAKNGPDYWASFVDNAATEHHLVVNVVGRAPKPKDVAVLEEYRAAANAEMAVLVGLEAPTAEVWQAVLNVGSVERPGWSWIPRVRIVTARELSSQQFELLPAASTLTDLVAA